jgi:hypothetical protein
VFCRTKTQSLLCAANDCLTALHLYMPSVILSYASPCSSLSPLPHTGKPDLKRKDGRHMRPEDFPFREQKTVSSAAADLSTLYDPPRPAALDESVEDDPTEAAYLSRLNRLAKTVCDHCVGSAVACMLFL